MPMPTPMPKPMPAPMLVPIPASIAIQSPTAIRHPALTDPGAIPSGGGRAAQADGGKQGQVSGSGTGGKGRAGVTGCGRGMRHTARKSSEWGWAGGKEWSGVRVAVSDKAGYTSAKVIA